MNSRVFVKLSDNDLETFLKENEQKYCKKTEFDPYVFMEYLAAKVGNTTQCEFYFLDFQTRARSVWMGNTDGLGIKTNIFSKQVQARYIRIFPLMYSYKMCMKLELFGCRKSKRFYLA